MEENTFKNKAYRSIVGELERLEHAGLYSGNGHHLAQNLASLLWDEFKGDETL